MTKIRALIISVICLGLLNVALLISIFITGHPKHKEPKYFIIEKLEFTPDQVSEYEFLMKNHRSLITDEEKKLIKLKEELYLTIKTLDKEKETELLKEIAIVQTNIELIHLNHFKEIQSVCKPEQLENYNRLLEKLPRLFSRKNHKKKRK